MTKGWLPNNQKLITEIWLIKGRLPDIQKPIVKKYLIKVNMYENKYTSAKKDSNTQEKMQTRKSRSA